MLPPVRGVLASPTGGPAVPGLTADIVLNVTHLAAEGRNDRLPGPLTTTRTGVRKLVG